MNIDYMIDVANKTIDLLSDEDKWTRVALARTKSDRSAQQVHPKDPSANCFCLIGAIAKNSNLPEELSYDKFVEKEEPKEIFNDIYNIDEVSILAEFLSRKLNLPHSSTIDVYRFNDRAESNEEVVNLLKEFRDDLILQKSI